jgi:hypothetical protein
MPAHTSMILECLDAVKGLPFNEDEWAKLSHDQRRSLGLISRWAIERALCAWVLMRTGQMPVDSSLAALMTGPICSFSAEQLSALRYIERSVTVQAPGVADEEMDDHLFSCRVARGIVQTVSQNMILAQHLSSKRK